MAGSRGAPGGPPPAPGGRGAIGGALLSRSIIVHPRSASRWPSVPALLLAASCGQDKTYPVIPDYEEEEYRDPYAMVAPPVEGLWVLDLSGETATRQLMGRSLQGVINRDAARIYILDDEDDPSSPEESLESAEHWLSLYEDRGVPRIGEGDLDAALAAFAPELDGYILAADYEPWTLNAATSAAGGLRAIVTTAGEAPNVEVFGLPQLDSVVGRWEDEVACNEALAASVADLDLSRFAMLRTTKLRTRDLFIQQGIPTLGGLEGDPEWAGVQTALASVPAGVAVYGYAAEDGVQELNSVTEISAQGAMLIPSDSAANLSFHLAMAVSNPTLPDPPIDLGLDCEDAELNVVIALSDGDNLVVATSLYPTSRYWLAPQRGTLALNWSISPALATFAPELLDYYVRTKAPEDELVMMIGPGNAYGGELPEPENFFGLGFQQMEALGLHVFWLFDPLESGSGVYSWQPQAEEALRAGVLTGLLDGYYPPLFHEAADHERVGGVPLLRAVGTDEDTPATIAAQIQALLALPKAERPPVAFFSAAAWSNSVTNLVGALVPLEAQGVRFLSASAGMECVPEAAAAAD